FSGTQCDRPVRLFQWIRGRWVGAVHETVDIQGPIGELSNSLSHRTIPDMTTFLHKIDVYTSLEAHQIVSRGRRVAAWEILVRPLWTFLKLYGGKQGFRDGVEGLAFCALSGVSAGVRAWKVREEWRRLDALEVERHRLRGTLELE